KAWVRSKVAVGKAKFADLTAAIPGAFGFRGGGESHQVYIEKAGARRVMVASNPTEGSVLLEHLAAQIDGFPNGRVKTNLRGKISNAREWLGKLGALLKLPDATKRKLEKAQDAFGRSLIPLFDGVHKQRMKLAGKVPKYATPAGGVATGTVKCVATFVVDCA